MQSGRHNNVNTTFRYITNSGILEQLRDRVEPGSVRHKVGDWHSIRTAEKGAFNRIARNNGTTKSVLELADWYTFEKLGIPRNWREVVGYSISEIFAKSTEVKPEPTLDQQMMAMMERHIPDEHARNTLRALIQKHVSEIVRASMNPSAAMVGAAPMDATTSAGPVGDGAAPTGHTQLAASTSASSGKRKRGL